MFYIYDFGRIRMLRRATSEENLNHMALLSECESSVISEGVAEAMLSSSTNVSVI